MNVVLATLDTGKLHPATRGLLSRIASHYGLAMEVVRPEAAALGAFVAQHGEEAMYRSIALRKACGCTLLEIKRTFRALLTTPPPRTTDRKARSSPRTRRVLPVTFTIAPRLTWLQLLPALS